jgi:hypothetical protein
MLYDLGALEKSYISFLMGSLSKVKQANLAWSVYFDYSSLDIFHLYI